MACHSDPHLVNKDEDEDERRGDSTKREDAREERVRKTQRNHKETTKKPQSDVQKMTDRPQQTTHAKKKKNHAFTRKEAGTLKSHVSFAIPRLSIKQI
jgi:hypothetical protein